MTEKPYSYYAAWLYVVLFVFFVLVLVWSAHDRHSSLPPTCLVNCPVLGT